jgi:hypothetical protein
MRRIVTAMAVLAVLLHSALLAGHTLSVFSEGLGTASCHGGQPALEFAADRLAPDGAGVSLAGSPAGAAYKCPICAGLGSAVALAAPEFGFVHFAIPGNMKPGLLLDQRVEHHKRIRPPGRAPPSLA